MSIMPWIARISELAPALGDAAARGTLVLAATIAVTHLLRRRSAAERHAIWFGAILVQLGLFAFVLGGPRWNVAISRDMTRVLPVELPREAPRAPVAPEYETSLASRGATVSVARVSPTNDRASSTSGRYLFICLWMCGALMVIGRLIAGTTITAMLARRGHRIEDGAWNALVADVAASLGITRRITLLRGESLGVPVTWGIVHPVVLLPADWETWPQDRRRLVAVHELAHVKRFDALTQFVAQIALAVFWFSPLVWLANRRMQMEREHACDDYVIRLGARPSSYAEQLLAMVGLKTEESRTTEPSFAVLAMARRSELEDRMVSILAPAVDRRPLRARRACVWAITAVAGIIPLAAMHPYARVLVTNRSRVAEPVTISRPASIPASAPELPSLAGELQRANAGVQAARSAATLDATVAVTEARPAGCDQVRFDGSTKTGLSLHSDDDGNGDARLEYLAITTDRCSSASVTGAVVYTLNEDDVAFLPPASRAVFRERSASDDRQMILTSTADGSFTRSYVHNGRETAYDADARAWLNTFLPAMIAETALHAVARVTRWTANEGINSTIAHISALHSAHAKQMHYAALLDAHQPTPAQADQIFIDMTRAPRGSSYEVREILVRVAPYTRDNPQLLAVLEQAVAATTSNHDRAELLAAYGQSRNEDVLMSVLRMTRGVTDDGERGRLLITLASSGALRTPALRETFLAVASDIADARERSRVLESVGRY